jgi:thiamine biosynthesis lipoprotein
VIGQLSDIEQTAVTDAIVRELAEVDVQMSTWRPDSEISRFNAAIDTNPIKASRGLLEVVALSLEIHAASGGAFDVTLAPLLDAWGFGPSGIKPASPPTDDQLAPLRARIGADKLHVDLSQGTLIKDQPELALELSAIAPGYAADRIAAALVALGHTHHMVDVGGEFRVTGHGPHGGPWRLGIERPETTGGTVHEVVLLVDQALATSGDYRNYYERDGVRLSHTLDPRTGRPIAHNLASVSVIHRSAALADGWATALNVLGPDAGLALAERQAIPALFLVRMPDGTFAERTTTPFAALRPDAARATLDPP